MEMKKALKIVSLVVVACAVLIGGGMFWNARKVEAQLPEYVGSKACLGCHSGKYERWSNSAHAHMVDQIVDNKDFPADPATAPADLQAELAKADYVVAGQRFLARDPKSGDLVYLNVQYDKAAQKYVPMKGGTNWDAGCAGCHSTGFDTKTKQFAETGIGCEMCHGPGRDHILGKGDVSKITVSTDAATCGQCHNGSGKNADGVSWPVGYRPNMKSLDEVGFKLPTLDPLAAVPVLNQPKLRQYSMWKASAHAKAASDLAARGNMPGTCWKCHSATAAAEAKAGQTPDPKTHDYSDSVSCVACHSPHGGNNYAQLKSDPKTLCESCHTADLAPGAKFKAGSAVHHPNKEMLAGVGSPNVADTKTFHSDLSCNECHMTEGNHMMKVIRPEEVVGTVRKDSCTTCHKDSDPETRGAYLETWQSTTETKLATLDADIATVDAVLKANPTALSADLKAKYDAAKTNVSFVEADGSNGAHNFEYAMKMLTTAQKDIAAAKAALGN